MKKIIVPINDSTKYLSEIEIPEGQTTYKDIIRRSQENIWAKILEDYPVLKKYIKIDTEYNKSDIPSASGNKGVYFRCVANENIGFKISNAWANESTTITTSTTETNNGFVTSTSSSVPISHLVTYTDGNETSSGSTSQSGSYARNFVKIENDKKIYCFKFYNCNFNFEYNDNILIMQWGIMQADTPYKIIFSKTKDNTDMILLANANTIAPNTTTTNPSQTVYLLNKDEAIKCVHYNQLMYGYENNLLKVGKAYISNLYGSLNSNCKIVAEMNDKFISITGNRNINTESYKERNRITVNGRLYYQVFCDWFIDITDDNDEEENNES